MPLDVAFSRPDPLLCIPQTERAARVNANDDYCAIDNQLFFIRRYLPVSIRGTNDEFGWGFWCKVSEVDCKKYWQSSQPDGAQIDPFPGFIANTAAGYDGIEGLKVAIQPIAPDKRPTLTLEPCNHLLYQEQQRGITMQRIHQINATLFPGKY